ncbi:ThiF family adenylyltransferase [Antribacter gilvus]|uniref:ThiF family adenylyltransferase n=1 Tax=Antribacter gilvus TaxID=2304675 RepID=UPI000F77465A|nr:ThiF family adenylyltransferase [Antribacter gilvus]
MRTARPVPLRLRPGTPLLVRGDGEVQCGTDRRWAFVLSGLDRAETAWLRELAERRHVPLEQAAARCGVAAERRDAIVDVLERAGVLVPSPAPVGRVSAVADGAADSPVLGMLRPDGAGLITLASRATRTVGIAGLGRTGAAVALHLATAGVGHLVLHDPLPVQTTDLGLGGPRTADLGRRRDKAVRSTLADRSPRVAVTVDDGDAGGPGGSGGSGRSGRSAEGGAAGSAQRMPALDVVVVVEPHAAHPARYRRLMGSGIPHLPVVVREADVVLGPFVRPGAGACVGCVDLHRADADPQWPVLASQLRETPEPPQETTLAATAAALAAGQVLAQLDGHRPAMFGLSVEVALPYGLPRTSPVPPHARCGCTGLPVR